MHCPHCGQEHPENSVYCPFSGKKIAPEEVCPQCGKAVEPGWLNCVYCGQSLRPAPSEPDQHSGDAPLPQPAAAAPVITPETRAQTPARKRRKGLIMMGVLLSFALVAAAFIVAVLKLVNLPPLSGNLPAEKILFVSDRSGNSDIYLMDAGGGNATNLTNNPSDDANPTWSPDGKRIAFFSNRDNPASYDLYLVNVDGSGLKRLSTNGGKFGFAAFSPDGQKIAFTSFDPLTMDLKAMTGEQTVYVINGDGSNLTRLAAGRSFMNTTGFSWSPDGREIVYVAIRDRKPAIFTINSSGGGEKVLSNQVDYSFSFSRDGKKVAFTSERDGNAEIYVMDADGSHQARLTNSPTVDSYPVWSPDGKRIAFVTDRDGNLEVYLMNADGSGQTNLSRNQGVDGYYQWSMDGSRLAFVSDRDGNIEIYVVNADGSKLTRLTNDPRYDWYPLWSPAATALAREADRTNNPTSAPAEPTAANSSAGLVKPSNPFGIGGYWKSIDGSPYVISLVDANGRHAALEVRGELRWDQDGRLTQWEGATFKIQTDTDPYTWSDITDVQVVDGLLVLTVPFGYYTHFSEGRLPTPLKREVMPVAVSGDGKWAGPATFIITGFNPQDFSATLYQDSNNYQIQFDDAKFLPTATMLSPTDTGTHIGDPTDLPAQPANPQADETNIGLADICKRIYFMDGDQVIVPDLSECDHKLWLTTLNGMVRGIVSGTGDLGMLPSSGMTAAVFRGIKFTGYTKNGNAIDKSSGRPWGIGEIWVSCDSMSKEIVIVKLDPAGAWSGYVNLSAPVFDLEAPLDLQPLPPLSSGNQFE